MKGQRSIRPICRIRPAGFERNMGGSKGVRPIVSIASAERRADAPATLPALKFIHFLFEFFDPLGELVEIDEMVVNAFCVHTGHAG